MPSEPIATSRIAPLRRIVAEPVTDPAERALLAKLDKQGRENALNGQASAEGPEPTEMIWRVIGLARQMSAADAGWLVTQVAGQLPTEEILGWTEQLLHYLSRDALVQLEKQLAERLAARSH
jgi:hypothetical protein